MMISRQRWIGTALLAWLAGLKVIRPTVRLARCSRATANSSRKDEPMTSARAVSRKLKESYGIHVGMCGWTVDGTGWVRVIPPTGGAARKAAQLVAAINDDWPGYEAKLHPHDNEIVYVRRTVVDQ